MLPFAETPSPAFRAAIERIAPLRTFSAEAECGLNQLANEIATTLPWQIIRPQADMPHHWYMAHAGYQAYLREDNGYNGAGYVTSPDLLREKLLSDIAHDLQLPTTAYALIANDAEHPDLINASLSLIPFRKAKTIYEALKNDDTGIEGLHYKSQSQKLFFDAQPQLLPAFAALSVFDMWAGIEDRHLKNTLVTRAPGSNRYENLFGIDFEQATYMEYGSYMSSPSLWQEPVTKCMPATLAPIVNAAVTAIENYPASRLNQLATRLSPFSREWDAAEEQKQLCKRQRQLRHAIGRCFSPIIEQHLNP